MKKLLIYLLIAALLIGIAHITPFTIQPEATGTWQHVTLPSNMRTGIHSSGVPQYIVRFINRGGGTVEVHQETMHTDHSSNWWVRNWTVNLEGFYTTHEYRIVLVSGPAFRGRIDGNVRTNIANQGFHIFDHALIASTALNGQYERFEQLWSERPMDSHFRLERRLLPVIASVPASIATPGPVRGGAYTVTWGAPSSWGTGTTPQYEVEFYNGSVWSLVGTTDSPTRTINHSVPTNIDTGTARYRVRTKTTAGVSDWIQTNQFTVDNTAPTITAANPTGWTNQNITITPTITDNLAGISQRRWASGNQTAAWMASSGTVFTTNFVVTGNGTYTIYARDTVGNERVQTVTVGNIDKTAPVVTVIGNTGWTNQNVTVTPSITDAGGSNIAERRWAAGSQTAAWMGTNGTVFTTNFAATTNGIHTVYARDNAGNEAVQTVTVNIDTVAPETPSRTLRNGYTAGTWTNQTVLADLIPGDAGLSGYNRIEYRLNGGTWTTGVLAEIAATGTHFVEYRAFDNAGNISTVGTASNILIDKVMPISPNVKIRM